VELLTLSQALALTGLARRTLFRYRRSGAFPAAVMLGGGSRVVLFRADEVRAWCRGCRR
jgi:predicted DNA-binding transcriptional regulator AlpA